MKIDELQNAGLTKGESKVYLALLVLGESTVGPIAKKAKVSLSKIYEILYNLINKGLVSSISKNNKKYFSAAEPERIIEYLEKRKKELSNSQDNIKKILPSLKSIKKQEKIEPGTIYQGLRGIKTFYESILRSSERGDKIKVMGIPRYAAKKYEGYFLDWNKRRARKGVSIKLIFDYDVKDLAEKRSKIKLSKIKHLSKDFKTPSWILITKNIVATIHLLENPICFVIMDKQAVESYSSFFDHFWKIAKK